MKRIVALLLLVFTVSVFLSGCSDSESSIIEKGAEWLDHLTEDDDTMEKAFDFLEDRGLGL